MASASNRYLLVSSDGHAGMRLRPGDPWDQYKAHLERRYWDDLDRFVEAGAAGAAERSPGKSADPFGAKVRDLRARGTAYQEGGETGLHDPVIRARELDRDGVSGEVIFAQAVPFRPMGRNNQYPYEFRLAGVRAHNRWLAEFCATQPERFAGVAQLVPENVDDAVDDVRWARANGLFGGIQLPPQPLYLDEPEMFYHHPRYEPLWEVCEELRMPIHSHVGGFTPDYGSIPTGSALRTFESMTMTAHRMFWTLLLSGALRRHPDLKLVFTESGGTWVPFTIDFLDDLYESRNPELMRDVLGMKPSEFWVQNCYIGASPPAGRREVDARDRIGVNKLMWGSDYPHPEGTWPYTNERLGAMFAGIPDDEVRMMVGLNAVRVYDFDEQKLSATAERIGPPADIFEAAPNLSGVEYARLWRERHETAEQAVGKR